MQVLGSFNVINISLICGLEREKHSVSNRCFASNKMLIITEIVTVRRNVNFVKKSSAVKLTKRKTKTYTLFNQHGRRQQGGMAPLDWIFIHDTDKVKGSLMVLFFGLIFFSLLPIGNFLPTPLSSSAEVA